jgi:hypothetical protein
VKRVCAWCRNISVNTTDIRPETIRLPAPGTLCPYTGLTRSAMNELILPTPENDFSPPVKSFCLRRPGKKKGIRLVDFDSLLAHIHRHEDTRETREAA